MSVSGDEKDYSLEFDDEESKFEDGEESEVSVGQKKVRSSGPRLTRKDPVTDTSVEDLEDDSVSAQDQEVPGPSSGHHVTKVQVQYDEGKLSINEPSICHAYGIKMCVSMYLAQRKENGCQKSAS